MKNPEIEIANRYFPNALPIPELLDKIDEHFKSLGYDKTKVRPAKSMCRDDTTGELEEELLRRGYPYCFNMQTLSGFPVYGLTAMTAFYHHIPDDGTGLIIYGPHIGINKEGRLGWVKRYNIKEIGKSCGAAHVLIDKWKNYKSRPFFNDPELSAVSKLVAPFIDRIRKAENPLLELLETEYTQGIDIISDLILKVQNTEHHKLPVILVSGIHIDTRPGIHNLFQLRQIRLYKEAKKEAKIKVCENAS